MVKLILSTTFWTLPQELTFKTWGKCWMFQSGGKKLHLGASAAQNVAAKA